MWENQAEGKMPTMLGKDMLASDHENDNSMEVFQLLSTLYLVF